MTIHENNNGYASLSRYGANSFQNRAPTGASTLPTSFQGIGESPNYSVTPQGYANNSLGAPTEINDSGVSEYDANFNPYITGIQAFSGLTNAYLGFKALDLGNQQLDFAEDSFNANFGSQQASYNTTLENQYLAQLSATNPHPRDSVEGKAYEAEKLASYLDKNQLTGTGV